MPRRLRRTTRLATGLTGAAAVVTLAVGPSFGAFRATTVNGNSFDAATLAAPTNLTVTANPAVSLSWGASASTWATGYRVLRATRSDGAFSQAAQVTGQSTTSYTDSPGPGTFYYRLRSYYGTTTWISPDTAIAARQDPDFVFETTQGFTGSGCSGASGGSGTTGLRDMEQGYPANGTTATFTGAASTGTIVFCSGSFSAGQTMIAGTTTVSAYLSNSAGSSCTVTATLKLDRGGTITSLGSGNFAVPASTGTTLRTWSFSTTAVTFAAGDRLNLSLFYNTAKACGSTTLSWNSSTAPSKVTLPSIDGYGPTVAGTSGLQSYWRLAETSGTSASDSKGTSTGTYTGGYTLGAAGGLAHDADKATTFDGSTGYVNIGDVYDFAGTTSFSVEFWVKKNVQEATSWARLVDKHQLTPVRDGWTTSIAPNSDTFGNAGKILFERWGNGSQSNVVGTTATAVGTWYYVVATYDGSTLRLYVNGSLEASAASSVSMSDTTAPLRIAASAGGGSNFNGTIDDVAIYNVALTAAQIQAHYDAR